jgi:hypothetical protein
LNWSSIRLRLDPEKPHTAWAELPESGSAAIESDEDTEIIGEIDDDEIDGEPLGIYRERESESAEIVDVELVDPGYTDAPISESAGVITPEPARPGALSTAA